MKKHLPMLLVAVAIATLAANTASAGSAKVHPDHWVGAQATVGITLGVDVDIGTMWEASTIGQQLDNGAVLTVPTTMLIQNSKVVTGSAAASLASSRHTDAAIQAAALVHCASPPFQGLNRSNITSSDHQFNMGTIVAHEASDWTTDTPLEVARSGPIAVGSSSPICI